MKELDRSALRIPGHKLLDELLERVEAKKQILAERDKAYGAARVRISSYPENITLPGLFGFDMNDYYKNPQLALEISLRSKIFWLDNSRDDGLASPDITVASMYFDMTLFGIEIKYQSDGVPLYGAHPLMEKADLTLLAPFDFYLSGEMPVTHERYRAIKKLSREVYDDRLAIEFPNFSRGPLDIYVQLRGYENFIDDTSGDARFTRELLSFIVDERNRYNQKVAELNLRPREKVFIADDWVNVPFISPRIFEEYVLPAYRQIQENEGDVTGFHTCGVFGATAAQLLGAFPTIRSIDISGWNDFALMDDTIDQKIDFNLQFINTFVLFAPEEEKRAKLEQIAKIAKHRKVSVCAQAIVKAHDTLDESIAQMNAFIDLAREVLRQ